MDSLSVPSTETILNDPAASYWLKQAVKDAMQRDPLDALADAIALSVVLRQRLKTLTGKG